MKFLRQKQSRFFRSTRQNNKKSSKTIQLVPRYTEAQIEKTQVSSIKKEQMRRQLFNIKHEQ